MPHDVSSDHSGNSNEGCPGVIEGISIGSQVSKRDSETSHGAHIASLLAQNNDLQAQLEQIRAERAKLLETQRGIMELIGARTPEKIIHDLRNVLNERDLLKALTAIQA